MWEFISDIVYFIVLTIAGIIALDYIFGTDKFKDFRHTLCTDYQFELYASAALLVFGTLHMIAHILDSSIFKDFTTVYMSIIWLVVWVYHTIINVHYGIQTFRNNNITKRKKPQ